jgi:4-alpha-glucanotransferase
MHKRASGVLLHITSLPSAYGIGDLGPSAYRFADFLHKTKQSYWQVLPLTPTDQACGNSPYSGYSAYGSNTLLISPELLVEEGLLAKKDIDTGPAFPKEQCDYRSVIPYKENLLTTAYQRFRTNEDDKSDYEGFCSINSHWLEDFALFVVLKKRFEGKVWNRWPEALRERAPEQLEETRKNLYEALEREKFLQYLFFKQWYSLKNYCNQKGIHLIGDIPIYVSFDSADVWSNPGIFKLNAEKRPTFVAGVPPDYFSKTGQLWGNPVYRWEVLKDTGFKWWIQRLTHNFNLFDLVRVDHFRGFVGFWQVASTEDTAINGQWVKVPAADFFTTLLNHFSDLPIIAEDLGIITPDVKEIMRRFGFPGMRVLLFAFGEDNPDHPYLPHNYVQRCVVYTGTHDNNTAKGWFENEAKPEDKKRLIRYLGRNVSADHIHLELLRLAMMSVAETVIIPMQDILGLGEEARMNLPASLEDNWKWRLVPEQMTSRVEQMLLDMTETYGRAARLESHQNSTR